MGEVHVAAPADSCRAWNGDAEEAVKYPEDILENLIFRYEEPNGMSRWDSPLFTVPYVDEKPDLEGIWDAMMGKGVVVKSNQATILVRQLSVWSTAGFADTMAAETCRRRRLPARTGKDDARGCVSHSRTPTELWRWRNVARSWLQCCRFRRS